MAIARTPVSGTPWLANDAARGGTMAATAGGPVAGAGIITACSPAAAGATRCRFLGRFLPAAPGAFAAAADGSEPDALHVRG